MAGLNWSPPSAKPIKATARSSLGDRFFLKLFRRVEPGLNPDLEVGRFLTEHHFQNIPTVAGWLEYRRAGGEPFTVGILTEYFAQAKDAWSFTLDTLSRLL